MSSEAVGAEAFAVTLGDLYARLRADMNLLAPARTRIRATSKFLAAGLANLYLLPWRGHWTI